MKSVPAVVALLSLFLFLCGSPLSAAEYPKLPVSVKLEGAKMAPVSFSHGTHVEKQKIACLKCHHKDAANVKACTTCHGKEAKGKTPSAKDAFHATCQGCHKEMAAKGVKAPTRCLECHKK